MLYAILGAVLLGFGLIATLIAANPFIVLTQLFAGGALLAVSGVTHATGLWERLARGSTRRGLLFGGNAALQTGALIAVLATCVYLTARHPVAWDWTAGQVYSLSQSSRDLLAQLSEEQSIEVYAFYLAPVGGRDLLERYARGSERFGYRFWNPNRDLDKSQLFGIEQDQVLIVCLGPCETPAGPNPRRTAVLAPREQSLSRAIRGLLSEPRQVVFLTGHGEPDPADAGPRGLSLARQALEAENMSVETRALAADPALPEGTDLVVVAGPTRPLRSEERELVERSVREGGAALFLVDAGESADLGSLFRSWGIRLGEDLVVEMDARRAQLGLPEVSLESTTLEYGDHPVTRALEGRFTVFPIPRQVAPEPESGDVVETLVRTGPSSYAVRDVEAFRERGELRLDPETAQRGPISIAVARSFDPPEAAAEDVRGGRVIVVGDVDFALNQGLTSQYNTDLWVNMANWLVGEEAFITIDRNLPRASRVEMNLDEVYAFSFLAIFLLPELLIVLGILHWWRRRSA